MNDGHHEHGRTSLRVATYNIHHGADVADRLDLARTAAVIAASGARLVGLQEVDRHWSERSAFADQAGWLAERLEMRVAYAANLDLHPVAVGQERRQYGTAILSRYPIRSFVNSSLPGVQGGEPRGFLAAEVDLASGQGTPQPLWFATTHLSEASPRAREKEAARIRELLGPTPRRTIVTGDLNARPGTPELKLLTEVLVDAWSAVHPSEEDAGHTFSAAHPERRIDYALVSPDITVEAARVIPDVDASDHLPLVVDLTW
ncbi:endonuclease/exonuclease/phosphatase family protein [Actinopolymorpha pittospori]